MTIRTKTEMYNQIATLLADNSSGDITEAVERSISTDIFDSCFSATVTVVNEVADLGTPVGGYYQLSAGKYVFNEAIDWGTNGLDLIDSNEVYVLGSPLLKIQTYTGTDPFIKSTGTDNITFVNNIGITTPNATAVEITTGGSFLVDIPLFLSCQKVANFVGLGFLTISGIAMVACDDGITCDGTGVATLSRFQWSSGADVGGTAYTALGAGSQRLVCIGSETEATATEAIFDIDATFGGLMAITGGVHSTGSFFKAGSRDQTDVSIESYHVLGTFDSNFIGSATVQDNNVATVISSTDVFVDVNLGGLALASLNIERWSMTDVNTGELTCLVDGFSGTLTATLSTVGSGGASEYHFRAIKNGSQINGIIANELSSSMALTALSVPVTADAGDTIVLQVANHDNTSNITIRYGDINIS